MKRLKYKFCFTFIVFNTFVSGCSKTPDTQTSHASTNKNDNQQTVIKVGSDMTFPPYEYLENNQPAGVDIEIMNQIAQISNDKVQWQDTRWTNLIPGLKGGKFDVLFSSMYITKDRLKQIDMIPYYKTYSTFIVRTDKNFEPKSPSDLCGYTVGAMKGTSFTQQVVNFSENLCTKKGKPAISLREFDTSPETTQALLSNAVDVQIDDIAVMKNAVKKLNGRIKITSTEPINPIVGGIGIRKGDTQTYQKIEGALNQLRQSGNLKKILDSYGLQEPTQQDVDHLIQ